MENAPLPHSMLLVCSSRSQKLRHSIVSGEGGLKGQARGAKMDDSDEIGGQKGACVNNSVADCSPRKVFTPEYFHTERRRHIYFNA